MSDRPIWEMLGRPDPAIEAWKPTWGRHFSGEFKEGLVKTGALADMIRQGQFGQKIVDMGSGKDAHLTLALENTGAKVVCLDLVSPEITTVGNKLYLPFDIRNLAEAATDETKQAIVRVADFFDLSCDSKCPAPTDVDSFVFSQILNYVDFEAILKECHRYLKPGGKFLIINQPRHTEPDFEHLLHEKGPRTNWQVIDFLTESGFEVELQEAHDLTLMPLPPDLQTMVLVVRKTV